MRPSQITHGEARAVSDYLSAADSVSHAEIVGALVNALSRIDVLERRLAKLEAKERENEQANPNGAASARQAHQGVAGVDQQAP